MDRGYRTVSRGGQSLGGLEGAQTGPMHAPGRRGGGRTSHVSITAWIVPLRSATATNRCSAARAAGSAVGCNPLPGLRRLPRRHNTTPPPQRRTPPGTLHWRGAVSKVPGLPGTGKGGRHVGGGLGSKSMSRMRSGAARRVWGIVLNWAHRPPNRHRWPAPTPPKKPGNANCVEGWPADPNSWNMGGGRWSKPILLGEDDGGCVEIRPLHACFAIP